MVVVFESDRRAEQLLASVYEQLLAAAPIEERDAISVQGDQWSSATTEART